MFSVLLGSLAGFLPAVLFLMHFIWARGTPEPARILRFFYQGGLLKTLFSGIISCLFFNYFSVQMLPFLSGFCIVLVAQCIGMWFFTQKKQSLSESNA